MGATNVGRGGSPLPDPLRQKMEASLAADFSGVRVHVGHEATLLGVVAYSQGQDLFFAPGQYDPLSPSGQERVGHELAHIQQQRTGRMVPAVPRGMVEVDDRLEAEVDSLGSPAQR